MRGRATALLHLVLIAAMVAFSGSVRYVCNELCADTGCCISGGESCCETTPGCCDELKVSDEDYVAPSLSKAPDLVLLACLPAATPRLAVSQPQLAIAEAYATPDPPPFAGRDTVIRTRKLVI